MKRFLEYFVLRETGEVEQAKAGFEQLRSQISSMFGVLHKAAQNTWGKGAPSLGDKLKQEIVSDLEAILAKIKGPGAAPAAVREECYRVAGEIENLLNEAGGIVDGLRPTGQGASGRPTYNMMDVLKNIEGKIMQSVGNLEQSVLGQKLDAMHKDLGSKVGTVGDRVSSAHADIDSLGKDVRGGMDKTHSGLDRLGQQVRGGVDDIRGDVAGYGQKTLGGLDKLGGSDKHDELMGRLGGIEKKLDHPPQPLPHSARDHAYRSVELLQPLQHMAKEHGVKVLHPYTGDEVDLGSLKSAQGISAVLGMASKDANFRLAFDGDEKGVPFNLGDLSNTTDAINAFYDARDIDPNAYMTRDKRFKTKAFGTVHGNKLAPIPIPGEKKVKKADREKAQAEADARAEREREERVRKQFGMGGGDVKEWLGLNVPEK